MDFAGNVRFDHSHAYHFTVLSVLSLFWMFVDGNKFEGDLGFTIKI